MKKLDSINYVLNNMNVYVRRAIYDIVPLGWEIHERIIFDYEIVYVAEGNCVVNIENTTYHAKKGDLFFIRPNIKHSMRQEGNIRLHQPHIHFDFHYDNLSSDVFIPINKVETHNYRHLIRKNVTSPNLLYVKEYFQFQDNAYVFKLMMHIIDLQNSISSADIIRKNGYLLELISFLIRASETDNIAVKYDYEIFEQANTYIESSYNSTLQLDKLCTQLGYSQNYFIHIYKNHFGITPKQYHEEIRIKKAISYLHMRNVSVTEIAYSLGFETIHDFSRFFKRKTGDSPSTYRKKLNL